MSPSFSLYPTQCTTEGSGESEVRKPSDPRFLERISREILPALREELKSKRVKLKLIADDTIDSYVGAKGRRRILTLAATDAKHLNVDHDDLVELLGKHPAPLRAWVRIATDITCGTVRMDAFGQKVLGLNDGDETTLVVLSTPQLPKGMASGN